MNTMTLTATTLLSSNWSLGWEIFCTAATFIIAAIAIFLTIRQLHFNAWVRAQDIFTSVPFSDARAKIFARLDYLNADADPSWNDNNTWMADEVKAAKIVCCEMDKFCRLVPSLGPWPSQGKKKALKTWNVPIAKAWFLLHRLVEKERVKNNWPTKWDAFQELGSEAFDILAQQEISMNQDPVFWGKMRKIMPQAVVPA